eukprot:Protomagalhaensia_sp_Gyna_25__4035@NODE_364_length_3703_cov_282_225164_g281_i0_p3_GENE_NODE_364_length_3703_cov_282_225164_g281_i0NODE_364_length_3703_cov_282_225164_g281_i0_p3_ORF_typecomplete_len167_score20_42PhdYeFM_antitox/PF02604_19/0_12_NODE_364_length_3703_cov_282_225164_g281_i014901990
MRFLTTFLVLLARTMALIWRPIPSPVAPLDEILMLWNPLHALQILALLGIPHSDAGRRAIQAGGLAGFVAANSPISQVQMATFPAPPPLVWPTEEETRTRIERILSEYHDEDHPVIITKRNIRQSSHLPRTPFQMDIFASFPDSLETLTEEARGATMEEGGLLYDE